MKLKFRFVFFSLSILPAYSGDDVLSSSKEGLVPSPRDDYSSKGVLGSSKGVIDSSKGVIDSSKGVIDSSKGVIDLISPSTGAGSRWTLGAGLALRNIGSVDFDTGITNLIVPSVFGMNSSTLPAGIGPSSGFFNRVYDNGFVSPGPRAATTGRTTDYGYQNQSQLQDNRLQFSADGGERRVVTVASANSVTGWREGEDWEISPYVSLSRLRDLGKGWSAGPSFHFSFTNVDGSRGGLNTLDTSERRDVFDVRATDSFDSSGLILPNAPYTGSAGAVAPLLPAAPVGRTFVDTLRSTDSALFRDTIQESLEVNLFGVSLGGHAVYRTDGRFLVGLGTGAVLNIADWDANRSDRLIQVTNGGAPVEIDAAAFRNSGTDLLFGFYLQGSVGYQISEALSLEASARYDWNESLRDSVGGSDFDVDLTGFSLGLGANYSF